MKIFYFISLSVLLFTCGESKGKKEIIYKKDSPQIVQKTIPKTTETIDYNKILNDLKASKEFYSKLQQLLKDNPSPIDKKNLANIIMKDKDFVETLEKMIVNNPELIKEINKKYPNLLLVDTDKDGFSDIIESMSGTDPFNKDLKPADKNSDKVADIFQLKPDDRIFCLDFNNAQSEVKETSDKIKCTFIEPYILAFTDQDNDLIPDIEDSAPKDPKINFQLKKASKDFLYFEYENRKPSYWEKNSLFKIDENGIPNEFELDSGYKVNSGAVCQYGLILYNEYISSKNEGYLSTLKKIGEWLLSEGVQYGNTVYYKSFVKNFFMPSAPWTGATIQGQALSLLTRLFLLTKDIRYFTRAKEVYYSFYNNYPNSNWFSVTAENGDYWLEEFPDSPTFNHILNGSIFALYGLIDFYLFNETETFLQNSEKLELFQLIKKATLTILNHLGDYIIDGKGSSYGLSKDTYLINEKYQMIHYKQLKTLYELTNILKFNIYSDIFTKLDSINSTNANKIWSIGIYSGESPLKTVPIEGVINPVLTAADVNDIRAAFVADPFMIDKDSIWYMFFEVMNLASKQGDIGLATSNDGINWKYEKIVLDEPFHLSFPHVFKWNNDYFMIPESWNAKSIRLYKAEEFPNKWVFQSNLLTGDVFIDSSILFYQNKWWIFTVLRGKEGYLRLFSSDNLTGPFQEHPKSPVIVDLELHTARLGGKIIEYDGNLLRFAQDDKPFYGVGINAFYITKLTSTEYEEIPVLENPIIKFTGIGWNANGMHAYDPHKFSKNKWIVVVDGW